LAKLILLIGESGSGKSTKAGELLKQAQEEGRSCVRVNRDSIRQMLWGKDSSWDLRLKRENENLVKRIEEKIVHEALMNSFDIIIDDINLSEKTQNKWKTLAENYTKNHNPVKFEVIKMDTSFDECILRDMRRTGQEQVGRAVIERQFLQSGRADFGTKKIVIVDVDGTLCDSDGIRSPYDESRVIFDKPYPVIVKWVQQLAPFYTIVIMSGRHCSAGNDTISWLNDYYVPFDHILCRNSGDNRPDEIVKAELLEGMYRCGVTPEQIAFILDDRPKIISMWRSKGLKVFPVRGAIEPF
jgi:predicted kinase